MKQSCLLGAACACLLVLASTATAAPITGEITFHGSYTHNGLDLYDATMIDITGDSATVTGDVTGSFAVAGITAGDPAQYNDFTFDPTGPVATIWRVNGTGGSFTFNLLTMSVEFQNHTLLALSGTGILMSDIVGMDDTFADWMFTANETGSNLTFFSPTEALAPPVIDPSARIADDAVIGDGSTVGANTVIKSGVTIGTNSSIGANVTINKDVTLGDNAVVGDGSTIHKDVIAGDNLTVGTNVTIHKDVVIGSNVTIGDNSQIHSDTVIGNSVVIGIIGSGVGVFVGNRVTIPIGTVIADGEVIPNNTTVGP